MALHLLILGPPGAGKGTQSERVARARGIPKISTGDILREAVHADTEVGRLAAVVMDRGELVGDDVMIGIIKERLSRPDVRGGFILDGFPRTVAQAKALDVIMTGRDPLIVMDIVVPEPELVRRLAARLICESCGANADAPDAAAVIGADQAVLPGGTVEGAQSEVAPAQRAHAAPLVCLRCGGRLMQRTDDRERVVRERLAVYHRNTSPLVEYYRARPSFRSIDGTQPADRVEAALAAAIEGIATAVGEGKVR